MSLSLIYCNVHIEYNYMCNTVQDHGQRQACLCLPVFIYVFLLEVCICVVCIVYGVVIVEHA